MELQKIRNKKIVFLVGISVLVLLAPGTYLTITNNSSIYLSQALELSMGHPPYILKEGLVARGPVFYCNGTICHLCLFPDEGHICRCIDCYILVCQDLL